MNKSSFLNNKLLNKSDVALICIIGMVAGFLVSRVALSISMFLFGLNLIWDVPPREWLRQKWWLTGLGWVAIYAITWFWTDDKANWHTRLEVKLPFLLLPLSFAFLPRLSPKQIRIFTISVGLMLVASAVYSVSFLIRDPAFYLKEYHQSHTLPTLPKEDHIRASTAIALYIIWALYALPLIIEKPAKWITGICIALLVVYLHVLAAKSGLLSLYIFLASYGAYLGFTRHKLLGLVVVLAIPAFFVLSTTLMPTFNEKRNFIAFTYYKLTHGDKSGEIGDINRLMSYDIASKIIMQHPWTGVGTGDMLAEMKQGYDKWYPGVKEENKLLPHNQFLIVALGCGLPATLLFAIWVFMPLVGMGRNRQSFFFFMVWLVLFLQLMIEPVLEVQYGVFLYLFFMLFQRHELPAAKAVPARF